MWTKDRQQRLIERGFLERKLTLQEGIPLALDILPDPKDPDLEIPYLGSNEGDNSFPHKANFVILLKPKDTFSRAQVLRCIALLEDLKRENHCFPKHQNYLDICFTNQGRIYRNILGTTFLDIHTYVEPGYTLSFSFDNSNENKIVYSATFGRSNLAPLQEGLARRHLT